MEVGLTVRQVIEIVGGWRALHGRGAKSHRLFHGGLGGEGLDLRKGAHPDGDRARHTAGCVGCEKNTGSAVETKPHGGTSTKGDRRRVISTG